MAMLLERYLEIKALVDTGITEKDATKNNAERMAFRRKRQSLIKKAGSSVKTEVSTIPRPAPQAQQPRTVPLGSPFVPPPAPPSIMPGMTVPIERVETDDIIKEVKHQLLNGVRAGNQNFIRMSITLYKTELSANKDTNISTTEWNSEMDTLLNSFKEKES